VNPLLRPLLVLLVCLSTSALPGPAASQSPGSTADTVPNVVGRTLSDAEGILNAARLNMVRRKSVPSSHVPGTVVAQEPAAGAVASVGDTVAVDVSIWMLVPDLTGLDTVQASKVLDENGMTMGVPQHRPSSKAVGSVLAQVPAAGSEVPPGATVQVAVAAGVPTPNVVGADSAAARRTVSARGLHFRVKGARDADKDPGTIVAQSPPANTSVPLETEVEVVVASGATVPDLSGRDSASAMDALHRARLTPGTVTHLRSAAKVGTLIRQSVSPGIVVRPGTSVDVWIAEGVAVPYVQGLTVAQARDSVNARGLTVDSTTEQPSAAPMGSVVAQDPAPGSVVPLRTGVDLVVARGVPVPSVVGASTSSALRTLAARKLGVGSVTQQDSPRPPGTVLSEDPTAGSIVPLETRVDLVVARGVPVPNLSGMDSARARVVLDSARLALGRIELRPDSAPVGSVLEQHPAVPDVVALQTKVDLVIARGVHVPDLENAAQASADSLISARGLIFTVARRTWSLSPTGTILEQDPPAGREVPLRTPVTVVVARNVPIWWISAGILLLVAGPLVVGRARKKGRGKGREKRKPKGDGRKRGGGTAPAAAEPVIELVPNADAGRQEFAVGELPDPTLELRWRIVPGAGRPTIETGGELIRSERSLLRQSREDETHE
jgi:beta-lactam-binding protein with PASTA domain